MKRDTPEHYHSDIEPIKAIEAWLSKEEYLGFLRGNVIKYIARLYKKDVALQDAKKAAHYLHWLIEALEGEEK